MSDLVVGSLEWARRINLEVSATISGNRKKRKLEVERKMGRHPERRAQKIIKSRFHDRRCLCMPSSPTLEKQNARPTISPSFTADEVKQRAHKYGFDFKWFFAVLREVGIFDFIEQSLGVTLEDSAYGTPMLVNVLNGNDARIDWEHFIYKDQRARYFFDLIKKDYRRHNHEVCIGVAQKPSRLSMMHVISAKIFSHLVNDLPRNTWRSIAKLAAVALDMKKGNTERIAAYQELARHRAGSGPIVAMLDRMAAALVLPITHPARITDLSSLRGIVLLTANFGTGLGREAHYARLLGGTALTHGGLHVFYLPSGYHPPHQQKVAGTHAGTYTESDEAMACWVVTEHPDLFALLQDMQPLDAAPVVPLEQILAAESKSIDTPGNAEEAKKYVDALKAATGEDVTLVQVTTSRHSARVYANYEKIFGSKGLFVYVCPDPGHEIDAPAKVNMNPIVNWVAEYIKRLFWIWVG